MVNPRFPHTCKIYRMTEPTPFDEGQEVIVYEGSVGSTLIHQNSMRF